MFSLDLNTCNTHNTADIKTQYCDTTSNSSLNKTNTFEQDIRSHQNLLEKILKDRNAPSLVNSLTESLYRFLNEINDSQRYCIQKTDSETLMSSYLNTVYQCFEHLQNTPSLTKKEKLRLLQNAQHNLGAPALMLSGGGTFGIYHLGVVKALFAENLLPKMISGSSMGSIAAGILATHTDKELSQLFLEPHQRDYAPLKRLSFKRMMKESCLLDPQRLHDCIQSNVGDMTFEEAFKRTGRVVSITVSPTRPGQKPRILNYLTSPNVLIAYASKASCSIPGLFPAVQLKQRVQGDIVPYCQDERWIDGSFASDIPRQRISRLCNVNTFIVSQANPHILPFIKHKQDSGYFPAIKDFAVESLHAQSSAFLRVLSRRNKHAFFQSYLNQITSMIDQDYQGDINIHPNFPLKWFSKFMVNPTPLELEYLINMGEESTQKNIIQIKNQTKLYLKISELMFTLQNSDSETAVA